MTEIAKASGQLGLQDLAGLAICFVWLTSVCAGLALICDGITPWRCQRRWLRTGLGLLLCIGGCLVPWIILPLLFP